MAVTWKARKIRTFNKKSAHIWGFSYSHLLTKNVLYIPSPRDDTTTFIYSFYGIGYSQSLLQWSLSFLTEAINVRQCFYETRYVCSFPNYFHIKLDYTILMRHWKPETLVSMVILFMNPLFFFLYGIYFRKISTETSDIHLI